MPKIVKKSQPVVEEQPSQDPPVKVNQPSPPTTEGENNTRQNLSTSSDREQNDAFEEWMATLQYRINRFKQYPFQARRRKLEGEVKMKATISPDGTLMEAQCLSGKKVFYASSMRAIARSLPLPPPGREPVTVTFSIRYKLL